VTRLVGWVLAGIAALVSVVLAVPVGGGVLGIAQLVAFRALVGLGLGTAALLVCGAAFLLPRARRTAAVPLVVALVLGSVAQGVVLGVRSGGSEQEAAATPLVVLEFNTLGVVPPALIANLVSEQHAGIVVLAETSEATATAARDLLARDGIVLQLHVAPSADALVPGVALLVSPTVGDYPASEIVPMRRGALVAEPTGDGPILGAVHPVAPSGVAKMGPWRTESRTAADQCATRPGAIVAGDFNATLDHPGLGHLGTCVDAAREVGEATTGTWPAAVPTWLATPIDHVLVDGRSWRVLDFDVLPATGGSDHRPVVATIEPR
jgi:hypothetical protein